MTSRTNDNFRQNFWTWVDPPPRLNNVQKNITFPPGWLPLSFSIFFIFTVECDINRNADFLFPEALSNPSGVSVHFVTYDICFFRNLILASNLILPTSHKMWLLKSQLSTSWAPREGEDAGQGGKGPSGGPWSKRALGVNIQVGFQRGFILTCGVAARTFCIESLSLMLSNFSLTHSIFSFLMTLFFSFAETLLLLFFSLAQTDAEIDWSWLLWIGGAGGGTWE